MPNKVCPANLGPKQKKLRLFFGVAMFVAASALGIWMAWTETPPFFRVVVFAPFFAAMLGFFQAKQKTCVVYAFQGVQNLDNGTEKIRDAGASERLRRQGLKIVLQAVLAAFGLTLLCILVR